MRKYPQVFLILLIFIVFGGRAEAQDFLDKMVATVSDRVQRPELITYSDLLWQLAMEPDTLLNPPGSDDLNRALQILIDQRLIALEAKRLPSISVKKEELDEQQKRILANFATPADFVKRLQSVGFESVQDENFQRILEQRARIEKYLDFRFRSFVVITPEQETKYYREVFVPDFRKKTPELLMPTLNEKRIEINQILTEKRIAEDIEKFLDNAKERAEIVILSPV